MRKIINSIILCLLSFAIVLTPAKLTAYCLKGTTASGEKVREGICAGGNMYFGKSITIYQKYPDGKIGKYIGTFECLDKGGTDAIKKGYVIDVWKPDLKSCQELMNLAYENGCEGNVYILVED